MGRIKESIILAYLKKIAVKKSTKILLIILVVIILDQVLKIWVKTHMYYGEHIFLFGLKEAQIHFVENNGMAFGLSLGGVYGKLALSVFRIFAVAFLAYYIKKLLEIKANFGLLCSFALILAGAIGNILDSAFYGMIFSNSPPYHRGSIAEFLPEAGGYASFLQGKVVDMLHFPVFSGHFPDWFPFWSNESFLFFRPVFNIADVAITLGVLSIIIFQRNFFSTENNEELENVESTETLEESDVSESLEKEGNNNEV